MHNKCINAGIFLIFIGVGPIPSTSKRNSDPKFFSFPSRLRQRTVLSVRRTDTRNTQHINIIKIEGEIVTKSQKHFTNSASGVDRTSTFRGLGFLYTSSYIHGGCLKARGQFLF